MLVALRPAASSPSKTGNAFKGRCVGPRRARTGATSCDWSLLGVQDSLSDSRVSANDFPLLDLDVCARLDCAECGG